MVLVREQNQSIKILFVRRLDKLSVFITDIYVTITLELLGSNFSGFPLLLRTYSRTFQDLQNVSSRTLYTAHVL